MPKLKKKLITARQKAARRINIAIARAHKKKKTRFGNPVVGKSKSVAVIVESRGKAKKIVSKPKIKTKRIVDKPTKGEVKYAKKTLQERGYKLGQGIYNKKTKTTVYKLTSPTGTRKIVTMGKIKKLISGRRRKKTK